MIFRDGENQRIEEIKEKRGISGDVYVYEDHFMESLVSHKRLVPNSTATTIEEAEAERIIFEEELATKRAAEARKAEEERLAAEDTLVDEESPTDEDVGIEG